MTKYISLFFIAMTSFPIFPSVGLSQTLDSKLWVLRSESNSVTIDKGAYLEVTGVSPLFTKGNSRSGMMRDLMSPSNQKLNTVSTGVEFYLPNNTVLHDVKIEIESMPGGFYTAGYTSQCEKQEISTADYISCMRRPEGKIKVPGQLEIEHSKELCQKKSRFTCGNILNTDWKLDYYRAKCGNIGDEYRKVRYTFMHAIMNQSFKFKIKAFYKKCEGDGGFESN